MPTFLQIASRVEAAVAAYISVRDFSDSQEWREKFNGEKVSTHLHGVLITIVWHWK
jgi:hypothetical protein